MSYSCKILLDSISETGKRLTTFEITFPRIVLSEFNTHRMFSRNSASSRAIPFVKQLDRVQNNPFIPEQFPVNTKGMQPQTYITQGPLFSYAKNAWKMALEDAIRSAIRLQKSISNVVLNKEDLTVHKQLVNRLLEPFMWHTVIVTATEWDNFFKLRCDENAQYEIRRIADLMYEAYHAFDKEHLEKLFIDEDTNEISSFNKEWSAIRPQKLKVGEWHCPLVYEEDDWYVEDYVTKTEFGLGFLTLDEAIKQIKKKISVARCARVSYLTHDGKRDIDKDLELFERLRTSRHYSPFEHVATPSFDKQRWNQFQSLKANQEEFENIKPINLRNGNFIGWRQMRQDLPNENCTHFRKEEK